MTISYAQQLPLIRIIIEYSLYTTLRNLKDQRCVLWTVRRKTCLPELELGAIYLGKHTDKIEQGETGTCARIEISQNVDNADQKVKWFPKVHKTYKLLWEAYF